MDLNFFCFIINGYSAADEITPLLIRISISNSDVKKFLIKRTSLEWTLCRKKIQFFYYILDKFL